MTLKPHYAILIVLLVGGLIYAVDWAASGNLDKKFGLVRPDADGIVRIDTTDLEQLEVRFYRFLNYGNQEVKFLVGRDEFDVIQVGFDAGDNHDKTKRGFSYQDGFIVDNKCETTTRLSEVNRGGSGCKPTPLEHRVEDGVLLLKEDDILRGWRYFR